MSVTLPKFELYYTLNSGVSDKKLTKKEITNLENRVKNLTDKEKCGEMIVMLICEHAKFVDNFELVVDGKFQLPYEGIQEENNIKFDMNRLPSSLCRILLKFCDTQ
jgi:hypothetical protein